MVNVDFSPAVILGVGMMGGGLMLWQIRQSKPWMSSDYDVVVSCVALLVGGILVFQGWRLDPLLLFGQLMTAGAALSFAVEALSLRSAVYAKKAVRGGADDLPAMPATHEVVTWHDSGSPEGWHSPPADADDRLAWEEQEAEGEGGVPTSSSRDLYDSADDW